MLKIVIDKLILKEVPVCLMYGKINTKCKANLKEKNVDDFLSKLNMDVSNNLKLFREIENKIKETGCFVADTQLLYREDVEVLGFMCNIGCKDSKKLKTVDFTIGELEEFMLDNNITEVPDINGKNLLYVDENTLILSKDILSLQHSRDSVISIKQLKIVDGNYVLHDEKLPMTTTLIFDGCQYPKRLKGVIGLPETVLIKGYERYLKTYSKHITLFNDNSDYEDVKENKLIYKSKMVELMKPLGIFNFHKSHLCIRDVLNYLSIELEWDANEDLDYKRMFEKVNELGGIISINLDKYAGSEDYYNDSYILNKANSWTINETEDKYILFEVFMDFIGFDKSGFRSFDLSESIIKYYTGQVMPKGFAGYQLGAIAYELLVNDIGKIQYWNNTKYDYLKDINIPKLLSIVDTKKLLIDTALNKLKDIGIDFSVYSREEVLMYLNNLYYKCFDGYCYNTSILYLYSKIIDDDFLYSKNLSRFGVSSKEIDDIKVTVTDREDNIEDNYCMEKEVKVEEYKDISLEQLGYSIRELMPPSMKDVSNEEVLKFFSRMC